MNALSPVDPALAMQEASQKDLVRRKQDMDALRKRLGDTATKAEKLRESCEGFEAIFLQKMWEQMRKTVPKEGYLHSKDEEMYQSLFDIELCKKMAGAGGIGLADMLYAQLSQQLEDTGRTTTPGTYRRPLEIAPAVGLRPEQPEAESARTSSFKNPISQSPPRQLDTASLYTPLADNQNEPEGGEARAEAAHQPPAANTVAEALESLRAGLGMAPREASGGVVSEWAAARDAAVQGQPATGALSADPAAGPDGNKPKKERPSDPALASWQGPGPVSVNMKPNHMFGRGKNAAKAKRAEAANNPPAPARGMAPQETLWPLDGPVVSHFGWQDDANGKRTWNAGVTIAAAPDTPVRAVLSGTVAYAGQPDGGSGHTLVIEHPDGYRSHYGNLESSALKAGDRVQRGSEIAKTAAQASPLPNGENSASLYFEFKKGEMALNPESAINRLTTAAK